MNSHRWRLVTGTLAVVVIYFAPYMIYRRFFPETVLEYVGGYVIRPSFMASGPVGSPDFTVNDHSRSFGPGFLGESFVSSSLVTRLASITGSDVASPLNDLYYPLARLDHLLTGRYARFKNDATLPIFATRKVSSTTATVMPSVDAHEITIDEASLTKPGFNFTIP